MAVRAESASAVEQVCASGGADLPLLILLHGTRLNGAQWHAYGPLLQGVAQVLAPDLPGHGLRAGETFSLALAAQQLDEMIAQAGPRPVVLGGHSLGGYVAMSYAQQHPQRLAGLALMGCAAEPRGAGAWMYRQVARLWEAAGPDGMARLDALWLGRVAHAPTWAAMRARGGDFGQIRLAWGEVMRHCGAHQLRQVACPVLLLGGSWDQLHIHARRFAAAAPQAQIVTKPHRSHLWPITHPQEVAAELRRWLQHILARRAAPAGAPR
ncbi:alpha/beta hydrolase [Vandammella animalimorsus]|uniref:Alpha/beta hydrolase n=1 Tax=Vandammella animalimorsus TaxID=2029117 RepID=A0A3M6R7H6_9BURK|nr:alpha/beta hydrolase [Vandammella animalimorsus]